MICKELFLDNSKEGRVFQFPSGGDYRSRRAINAFFFNQKKRNKNKNILYIAKHEDEYRIEEQIWEKSFGEKYEAPKIIQLESIFALFDVIGFDNKTKKYN